MGFVKDNTNSGKVGSMFSAIWTAICYVADAVNGTLDEAEERARQEAE